MKHSDDTGLVYSPRMREAAPETSPLMAPATETWHQRRVNRDDAAVEAHADDVAGLASRVKRAAATARDLATKLGGIVKLNVGGTRYDVPATTLLSQDEGTFFHLLLKGDGATVERDEDGAVLIDRDGDAFRHVLQYLRGYDRFPSFSAEDLAILLDDIEYYAIPKMRPLVEDAPDERSLLFQAGPGVNPEGTRLRAVYAVSPIGDRFIVAGRHQISFDILAAEYLGFGVISDQCFLMDQEYHRTTNCIVYYVTGVFYSNCPTHRKEDGLSKLEPGQRVTLLLDMDDKTIEFFVNGKSVKIQSVATAARLRFAVTMKRETAVRIVEQRELVEEEQAKGGGDDDDDDEEGGDQDGSAPRKRSRFERSATGHMSVATQSPSVQPPS
jgi:hypothetical protein